MKSLSVRLVENKERLREILIQHLEKSGLEKTLKITGLNVLQLFETVGDFDLTPEMCYEIIYELFKIKGENNPLIKKVGHFSLDFYYEGTLGWVYEKDSETMRSLCTPFWDGSHGIPCDTEYYYKKDSGFEKYSGELNMELYDNILIEHEFQNINELIDWFNLWYIPSVTKVLFKHLKSCRALRPE